MAGKKVSHPAKMLWLLTIVCLLCAIAFTAAAAVVPKWSRIPGTSGINALADGGYLTSMASTNVDRWSTVYIGLWRWCLDYGDKTTSYLCSNTGGATTPAFSRSKCQGHLYAARHLNWIAGVFFFLALVPAALCFMKCSKWAPGSFWKAPAVPALATVGLTILGLGLAIACWVCWIVLVEERCRGGAVSWDPIQGYSSSFIFMLWATFFVLLAFVLSLLGFSKLNRVPDYSFPTEEEREVVVVDQPAAYVAPAAVPVSYPTPLY